MLQERNSSSVAENAKGSTKSFRISKDPSGHEGKVSSVAAGLPVNKTARMHKSKISKINKK